MTTDSFFQIYLVDTSNAYNALLQIIPEHIATAYSVDSVDSVNELLI